MLDIGKDVLVETVSESKLGVGDCEIRMVKRRLLRGFKCSRTLFDDECYQFSLYTPAGHLTAT
jgi:hypothetical protein